MKNKGFTFIEVLICVAVVGILLAVLLPSMLGKGVTASRFRYAYDETTNVCLVYRAYSSYSPQPIPCTPAIIDKASTNYDFSNY